MEIGGTQEHKEHKVHGGFCKKGEAQGHPVFCKAGHSLGTHRKQGFFKMVGHGGTQDPLLRDTRSTRDMATWREGRGRGAVGPL